MTQTQVQPALAGKVHDFYKRQIVDVSVRLATQDDTHLRAFDNSALVAVNTCPIWGLVSSIHKRRMSAGGRAMALEAGAASHDVFAAVRLHQLMFVQDCEVLGDEHGRRIFGAERWNSMLAVLNAKEDSNTTRLNFCLEALHTSGYYDDPQDRYRTLANIEESCIAYLDRWDTTEPVWVGPSRGPKAPLVGIEIPFDIVVTFTFEGGSEKHYRFIGRIDGIHMRRDAPCLHENKTGARLNEAWTMSWATSHQLTGYCLAASLFTETPVQDGFVLGMQIPLPKSAYDYGGIVREYFTRPQWQIAQWFEWFLHGAQIVERYENDLHSAPRYTHSCNRYFRPCSMIPYCASDEDERDEMLEEMVIDTWSPLDSV